jgi:1,4-alpha-glucan branching enzyme
MPRPDYTLGVPRGGRWLEVLNGDSEHYGGSGWGSYGGVEAEPVPWHGRPFSMSINLPPLAAVFFKPE